MIKAAVIGCGRMGAHPSVRALGQVPDGWLPISHVESLQAVEGLELVALADTNLQELRKWGAHYGVAHLYEDYRALIDEVRPDIVTIATRTPPKAEIIRYACNGGVRGLYVEKPLACCLADCAALLTTIVTTGVKLAYGVNRRYHDVYRAARDLLRDGEIGEIREVIVEHGRSQLFWTHPHSMDLIVFLAGTADLLRAQAFADLSTVDLQSPRFMDSDPVIEHAYFEFASGVTASLVKAEGLCVRVAGTEGTLVVHANGAHIQVDRRRDPHSPYFLEHKIINPAVTRSATVVALSELVASLGTTRVPGIDPAEIELGTRMLLGCAWSHVNGGAPVDAAKIPPEFVVSGRSGDLYV